MRWCLALASSTVPVRASWLPITGLCDTESTSWKISIAEIQSRFTGTGTESIGVRSSALQSQLLLYYRGISVS